MKKVFLLTLIGLMSVIIAACSQQSAETITNENQQDAVEVKAEDMAGKKVNEFDLTAKETSWKLSAEHTINAWTYNGTVPGEQIRVTEGEVVKVNLTNQLEKPVSIHWHGIPVPNTEDGIPGVTQDAVKPGETYTYAFVASDPGTYWYHSHQNGVEQLDKGLYGTIIVEPKNETNRDRDYTLVLDEWESEKHQEKDTEAMNHSSMSMDSMNELNQKGSMKGHDMSSYDIFTINGKTYEGNKTLKVKKGDLVKLRFINAGYMAHQIHIPIDYQITHVDGQKVNSPQTMKGSMFEVAPGERVDVEFLADGSKDFSIDRHGEMEASQDMKIDIAYEEGNGQKLKHLSSPGKIDITKLGEQTESQFKTDDEFDVEYELDLGTRMDMDAEMGMVWTINGKTYPNAPPLNIDKGDVDD